MEQDWRLNESQDYLLGLELKAATFHPTIKNDHEHCVFCFQKFSEGKDSILDGYSTLDEYHWICPECFSDFKELFKWKIVKK